MSIGIKIVGLHSLVREWRHLTESMPNEIQQNIHKAGELIAKNAQTEQMGGERTRAKFSIVGGRPKRRKNPRPVTAKSNQLGIFLGTLRRSISVEVTHAGTKYRAEVGPKKVAYARIHELGGKVNIKSRTATLNFRVNRKTGVSRFSTAKRANFQQTTKIGAHSITMPARPYLRPALKATEEQVVKMIGRAFVFQVGGV